MTNDFESQVASIIADLGTAAKEQARDVALYVRERAAHLASIVGQPGYAQAFAVERDALMLKAAVATTHVADETDRKAFAVLDAVLRLTIAAA